MCVSTCGGNQLWQTLFWTYLKWHSVVENSIFSPSYPISLTENFEMSFYGRSNDFLMIEKWDEEDHQRACRVFSRVVITIVVIARALCEIFTSWRGLFHRFDEPPLYRRRRNLVFRRWNVVYRGIAIRAE